MSVEPEFVPIVQFILGAAAFLWPKFSKSARETLVPYHMFLGRATFIAGLATMAVRSKSLSLITDASDPTCS